MTFEVNFMRLIYCISLVVKREGFKTIRHLDKFNMEVCEKLKLSIFVVSSFRLIPREGEDGKVSVTISRKLTTDFNFPLSYLMRLERLIINQWSSSYPHRVVCS